MVSRAGANEKIILNLLVVWCCGFQHWNNRNRLFHNYSFPLAIGDCRWPLLYEHSFAAKHYHHQRKKNIALGFCHRGAFTHVDFGFGAFPLIPVKTRGKRKRKSALRSKNKKKYKTYSYSVEVVWSRTAGSNIFHFIVVARNETWSTAVRPVQRHYSEHT